MSKKILIVDDSNADLTHLKKIVDAGNYQTITATNGADAITAAIKEHPSLIFMDIIMDEMDGFKACRQMSENPETKDIPIIFVSSKNQRADHMWATKQGAKELISKPYKPEDIQQQIIRYA